MIAQEPVALRQQRARRRGVRRSLTPCCPGAP
jgi:hypothetical protein